jgi:hypothetical protein
MSIKGRLYLCSILEGCQSRSKKMQAYVRRVPKKKIYQFIAGVLSEKSCDTVRAICKIQRVPRVLGMFITLHLFRVKISNKE